MCITTNNICNHIHAGLQCLCNCLQDSTVPYITICTVLYSTAQSSSLQYSSVEYITVMYSIVQYTYYIVRYSTVRYSMYSKVRYSTVHTYTNNYISITSSQPKLHINLHISRILIKAGSLKGLSHEN